MVSGLEVGMVCWLSLRRDGGGGVGLERRCRRKGGNRGEEDVEGREGDVQHVSGHIWEVICCADGHAVSLLLFGLRACVFGPAVYGLCFNGLDVDQCRYGRMRSLAVVALVVVV